MLVSVLLLLISSLSHHAVVGQKPPSDAAPLNHDLELTDEEEVIALWMPKINTTKEDQYFCMGKNVDFDIRYIVKYVPHASAKSVHHILIYGCSEPIKSTSDTGAWSCLDDHPIQGACNGRSKFLFAWAKDAPTFQLPKDVGFQLGRKTDVKGIFIQIHYSTLVTNDDSGFSLVYTSEPRKYAAGIFLLAAGGQFIPPGQPAVNVNILCRYQDDTVIHPFGFRTHAHGLGVVISGWYMKQNDEAKLEWTMLGKQSPQNPQAFYPMPAAHNITKGTLLGARCVFNSTERTAITFMGPTHKDEMCNFYMMYYADRNIAHDSCGDVGPDVAMYQLPKEASIPLPASEIKHHHGQHGKPAVTPAVTVAPGGDGTVAPGGEEHIGHEMPTVPPGHGREGELGETNEVPPEVATEESAEHDMSEHDHNEMEEHEHGEMDHGVHIGQPVPTAVSAYEEDDSWSTAVSKMNLGQISGVALGPTEKHVYIFHRNDHTWDGSTFDANNNYAHRDAGPIAQPTIAIIDAATGKLRKHIGQKTFYMPHGITVDAARNIWVTDVALHQVFKLSPDGQPTMILGKQFQPGHDGQHFCKPSMVAVLSSGDFFVADGYCNSRVIRFNRDGNYVSRFGTDKYNPYGSISPAAHEFFIPHDIKLSNDEKTIFVADRENGRVQAFDVASNKFLRLYQPAEFGSRLFALDLSGDLMVAVNGQVGMTVFGPEPPVSTILVNVSTGSTVRVLTSKSSPLANPHAVVVSKDKSCIYVVELNSHAHKFHLPYPALPAAPTAPTDAPEDEHGHHHGHDMEPVGKRDGPGFSFIVLMLIIVPTLIVLAGGAYFCIRQWKTSSNQSKWKELLYQYGHSVKNPMDLGGYKARKEGFRPLRQTEAVAGESSDSEDEAFSAPRYSRNALV